MWAVVTSTFVTLVMVDLLCTNFAISLYPFTFHWHPFMFVIMEIVNLLQTNFAINFRILLLFNVIFVVCSAYQVFVCVFIHFETFMCSCELLVYLTILL